VNPCEQLLIAYAQWLDQWFCEVERFVAEVHEALQEAER
jgi:hypothetical protein